MVANNKKRILIFSLVYYPRFIGGAEVAVKEITNRLARQNFAGQNLGGREGDFSFDMITLRKDAPKFERVGNVNVYRVGFGWRAGDNAFLSRFKIYKYFFPFFAVWKALALERQNHYDATWSIMANYAGFGALFFKLLRPKIPFILTLQEGDPIEHIKKRVGIFRPLFKMIFTRADIVQTISRFLADFAREMGAKAPIIVVPNGVNVEGFRCKGRGFRDEKRMELGYEKEDTVLATTSRLVEKNAVGDIIDALQYLPEEVKLLVIGTGQLESSLKSKVKSQMLDARVCFAGFVPHEKLPPYLWASDIFVRPSLSEGMGNSFIEAMCAGLPVIATPVGGIPDFLRAGETGLFCETGNPGSIAQKVQKLMKDFESRKYIVENASRMVAEKYDWDLVAKRMREEVFSV